MSDPFSNGDVVAALRDALGADCISVGDAIGARHFTSYGEAARPRALRSDAGIAAMRRLHAFDPLGLLNPGKVI
ncbi:hypothetical protein QZM18_06295 [Burkholderia diffusa]|uniref:hypothetical protein n=1 Tax=Burkholderia diffusa TaxID=488732 RepID=UPI002655F897|nr:hypothetical protein [Burkholderia diffusa]MDN7903742.1 hypothetical protein [Burkholderia diffusa]